jgi:hypothetical protein
MGWCAACILAKDFGCSRSSFGLFYCVFCVTESWHIVHKNSREQTGCIPLCIAMVDHLDRYFKQILSMHFDLWAYMWNLWCLDINIKPKKQESNQTSLPVCMHKMHKNYLWSSKVVAGSPVCNRTRAASVDSRASLISSSSIAKVCCILLHCITPVVILLLN